MKGRGLQAYRFKTCTHKIKSIQKEQKKNMKIKNSKLYMKNKSIIEENEKLRKKPFLLHQENHALYFSSKRGYLPMI
ncbi:hypothetical protein MANES_05G044050v8 [Manihot esculenta]|uniref:Uncharacterized protein n=1 Tax=Manihot esculenta TaxID=3983 RepID=A0ACB7HM97_MANES|nr:hypothetical protein MANES_05G044050v8 [Manihot esculenta]